MSNNNAFPAPTGNNNNRKKKKRKQRTYLPAADEDFGQNKRRNAPHPVSTPVLPPAQPGFGFGNPQMANPAAYAPTNTPFAGSQPGFNPPGIGSTAFAPQWPHLQAQPQWPQQQPQHVPHPGGYVPDFHVQPTPGFSNIPFSAGQQQMTSQAPTNPQHAGSSAKQVQKRPVELFKPEDANIYDPRNGSVPKIELEAQPSKTNIIVQSPDPNTTTRSHGERSYNVINSQIGYLQATDDSDCEIGTAMTRVPLMSGSTPARQISETSQSNHGLVVSTKKGRRQKPGTTPAQPPPPSPAQAQAPVQGQGHPSCPNCGKAGHTVGDCVGPPNLVHGDLPACPICDSFAGRVKNATGPGGHRFDDCERVQILLYSHQWDRDRRLAYEDLASLTDNELRMLFDVLVVKRLRKVPIRTQLFCWIDVLRETARRFPNSESINAIGDMRPWTKEFATQRRNSSSQPVGWDLYDYAAGNILSLPSGPVEQVETKWKDFVADGFPQFPPQVFVSSDRRRLAENLGVGRELEGRRENRISITSNRDNREFELVQSDEAMRQKQRAGTPAEGSPWKATLNSAFQYLADLNPVHSGSYGPGFKGVNNERLMRPLTYFLARGEKRDRFTAFLEAGLKPDGWYCIGQICSTRHSVFEPVDGKCVFHHKDYECPLQVRHLDASSGGRTLDFRVEIPDGDDDEREDS